MSNYGAPGQYGDDAEIERQLQEEYRRRQAMQQQQAAQQMRAGGAQNAWGYGAAYPQQGMAQGQQQQGAAYGHHPSPYTQVTNPYSGLADARAAYARGNLTGTGAGAAGAGGETPSAQAMYAQSQQQRLPYPQQQQQQQQHQQQGTTSAQQQQMYAAYGAQQRQAMDPYGAAYGGNGAMPYRDYAPTGSTHLLQHQQQPGNEQDPYAALRTKPRASSNKQHASGDDDSIDEITGKSKRQGMLQKVTHTTNKAKSTARIIVKDGATVIEDGTNQWFTGCVPLGLEDDKYWLSELQVYLRSNFAEAFGATEEDIAAPMHGRNKPIALGQVGIRCLHCKREYY